ncbi:MAG TPA: methionine--tRNA ligase, partial [Treponemataceae bacterium]|nr:methionine--tRNA ligase [Treponemataceae bacterium]
MKTKQTKRRLITSALPYVNNVPHLGNLIQVLSADVFARFCRSYGYDCLYICGTDEYGTATETKAAEEGISPKELCDRYHKIHKDIYDWFHIDFDHFGRTSTPQQTEITQALFLDLDKNGFIVEKTIEQLFCTSCDRFLADRYVRGTCPHCGFDDARGDQCEHCGNLLEPQELLNSRCLSCSNTPELRETKHLYIDLPKIQENYGPWMKEASEKGQWARNALQMTQAWIRDGLKERAITRDLKWGIPVPKKGYENKVFYVWFDAPIGYISITKALTDSLDDPEADWKAWWLPEESKTEKAKIPVELFQFIGKDNIPFHTLIFPSTLIGSGKNWTKLFHMSSTEYLNYENGKFSKSKGVGVFGNDAKESGIPADAWRFYIFYNRPEKSDTQFTWKDFQEKYNSELIGNLGNLVNRTLTFISRYYDGIIPEGEKDRELWEKILPIEEMITKKLDWAELKEAFHGIFEISSIANKAFQDGEPWKTRETNPEKAKSLLFNLVYVIKDLMILASPFIPEYSKTVLSFLKAENLVWEDLGLLEGLDKVYDSKIIFKTLDNATIDSYRERYAGSQKDRKEMESKIDTDKKTEEKAEDKQINQADLFNSSIALKIAKIVRIEKHPEADKLYIENLDDGSGEERVILSGLVPYYEAEELLGKHIVLADNLKPRKMRGIESRGMLLAADYKDAEGNEKVEVLDCPWAAPGTPVILEGADPAAVKKESINADVFFSCKIE